MRGEYDWYERVSCRLPGERYGWSSGCRELVIEDYCVPRSVSTIMGTPPTSERSTAFDIRSPADNPENASLDSLTLRLAGAIVFKDRVGRWAFCW